MRRATSGWDACHHLWWLLCVDPFVKVLLLYNGQRVGKKRTQTKKKTLNPTFNESFMFDLPPACCSPVYEAGRHAACCSPGPGGQTHLRGVRLQFIVYDWDRVTRNEVIGHLEMGDRVHQADTPAQRHWNEMVNSPRKQFAEWHRLQPWRHWRWCSQDRLTGTPVAVPLVGLRS